MTKSTTFRENVKTQENKSDLTINIYFSADNYQTWFESAWLSCSCNGQTQGVNVSHPIGGSASASFTFYNIDHDQDGTKNVSWSWSCATGTSVLGTVSDSGVRELTPINRYARTDNVTGSNIEENFSVNYTKYVSTYSYKLRISIPQVVMLERIDYPTSGASFKLSEETIEELYDRFPNTDTFNLGFAVESWSGNERLTDGNEVIISASKTDRIARLRISDEWERATPYVRLNGEWEKAIPYTRINNEWKRGK